MIIQKIFSLLIRLIKIYYMKIAMLFKGNKNDHHFHDLMYVILKQNPWIEINWWHWKKLEFFLNKKFCT